MDCGEAWVSHSMDCRAAAVPQSMDWRALTRRASSVTTSCSTARYVCDRALYQHTPSQYCASGCSYA
eukprot:1513602-Rhodomonas_salina.1